MTFSEVYRSVKQEKDFTLFTKILKMLFINKNQITVNKLFNNCKIKLIHPYNKEISTFNIIFSNCFYTNSLFFSGLLTEVEPIYLLMFLCFNIWRFFLHVHIIKNLKTYVNYNAFLKFVS